MSVKILRNKFGFIKIANASSDKIRTFYNETKHDTDHYILDFSDFVFDGVRIIDIVRHVLILYKSDKKISMIACCKTQNGSMDTLTDIVKIRENTELLCLCDIRSLEDLCTFSVFRPKWSKWSKWYKWYVITGTSPILMMYN